ncbi:MAG: MFS transporter [Chitinophagaceae bacterium]|nr:MFS transporter [Chitinophagaceae bacterium]
MTQTVAKQRWARLIPIAFITYSLAYLDRTNFSFATAGGMATDLKIDEVTASLLSSLFFLGYFFFQIPGALYAANRSAKKLIFWSLLLWGGLAAATGMVKNIPVLMAIRFALGVVESAVMPAMIIFLSRWFTKAERSRANTFLILGNPVTMLWMSIVSGYLIKSVGWRHMFIIEGVPAIVWAFLWWKFADEKPRNAKWLSAEEKDALELRLNLEQQSIKPVKNYGEAFRSKAVILLCLQYALWSIGVYGFVMWLPSIIKTMYNNNIVATGWLSAVPFLLASVSMLTASWFSDKMLVRKIFVWPFLLIGAIAFYASYLIGEHHFWLSFTLLVIAGGAMYAPYGPFFAAITEVLPKNVAAGAVALINSFGALGSFAGAYLVGYLNGHTHNFNASYIFMAGSLFVSALLTVAAFRERKNE